MQIDISRKLWLLEIVFLCVTIYSHETQELQTGFSSTVKQQTFIDKTLMIKTVLEVSEYAIITVPRGFGKSTNIQMLKSFFEIEINSKGEPLTKVNIINEPVTDTRNYRLFIEHQLRITQNKKIMATHFGKYPVIFIDFQSSKSIGSFEESINLCRKVVRKSYLAHEYLIKSKYLDNEGKHLCEIWCSRVKHKTLDIGNVTDGLKSLSWFLSLHYNRSKCILLVDNYDYAFTNAILRRQNKELKNIVSLVATLLQNALINNVHTARGIIVGVTGITDDGLSSLNKVCTFKFLGAHPFVEYFGFTNREIEHLFAIRNLSFGSFISNLGVSLYNGYLSRSGLTIYNMDSIFNFLNTGAKRQIQSYSGKYKTLGNAFSIQLIRKRVIQLLLNKTIFIDVKERLTFLEVIKLRKLIEQKSRIKQVDTDLFFSFMLEKGYLTYVVPYKVSKGMEVKIPNTEVMEELLLQVQEYYTTYCDFDKELMKESAMFFDRLPPNATNKDPVFIKLLLTFYLTLKRLFQGFSQTRCIQKLNENELHIFMAILLLNTQYQSASEYHYKYKSKRRHTIIPDLVLWKGNFAVILEFKHKTSSLVCSKSGLKQIITKQYYRVFNSDLFKHKITNYILMGLAIDDSFNPYISCLPNSLDMRRAMHYIPEKHLNTYALLENLETNSSKYTCVKCHTNTKKRTYKKRQTKSKTQISNKKMVSRKKEISSKKPTFRKRSSYRKRVIYRKRGTYRRRFSNKYFYERVYFGWKKYMAMKNSYQRTVSKLRTNLSCWLPL